MVIVDLINSCSNDKVAHAALACIGGGFAERVRAAAEEKGVSVGKFVAMAVRDFASRSDEAAQEALRAKVVRDDQPLLRGLREVLQVALERDPFSSTARPWRRRRPTPSAPRERMRCNITDPFDLTSLMNGGLASATSPFAHLGLHESSVGHFPGQG